MDDNVNIVIQVEGIEGCGDVIGDEDDWLDEANEWYFNDDPYGIVYYEFPYLDDQVRLMENEVHYYILDEEGVAKSFYPNKEAYIDDNDLKELLIDFL